MKILSLSAIAAELDYAASFETEDADLAKKLHELAKEVRANRQRENVA